MKRLLGLILVFILGIMLLPTGQAAAVDENAADVRIFHALTDVGEADFYLNDFYAGTVGFGAALDYMLVSSGDVRLRAFAPGSDPASATPLFEGQFAAEAAQHLNVALLGSAATATLSTFPIDRSPLPFGIARVKVIRTVESGPALTVTATAADGSVITLADGLAFGGESVIELPAGTYTLDAGDVLTGATLNATAGILSSVFIVGTAEGNQVRVFPSQVQPEGAAGFLRLVHGIADGDAADVYINGTLIAPGLVANSATPYLALTPGGTEVSIFAAGTTENPLLTSRIDITDGGSTLGVITSGGYGPQLSLFADDRVAAPEGQGTITVFNLAGGTVDLAVDGTSTVSGLTNGLRSSTVTLAEGQHELVVSVDGTARDTFAKYAISPHTATNLRLFVVTNTGTLVLLSRPA